MQAQYDRAMTGVSLELGIAKGRPANASKFFNSTDMDNAIHQAETFYAQNPNLYKSSNNQINIDLERPIGEGFMGNTKTNQASSVVGEYRWTNIVTVGIDEKTGKAYTAFPSLDKGKKRDNNLLKCVKKIGVNTNENCEP